MRNDAEELTGEFSFERVARGGDDSADRWIVGELVGFKTVVGCASKGRLVSGRQYRFLGNWRTHDTYGKQFAFSSFVEVEPADLGAIQRYLTRSPGIGPQLAARIVGRYGESSLNACREQAEEVARECNISLDTMRALAVTLRMGKARERITLEVEHLLHGFGFPKSLPQKVIEEWQEDAPAKIRQNPFCLRRFQGVGFLKCDALYEKLGLPLDAIDRQMYCVVHALEADSSGSTWLPKSTLSAELNRKVSGASIRLADAIKNAIDQELICERSGHYALFLNAQDEDLVVHYLLAAIRESFDDFGFISSHGNNEPSGAGTAGSQGSSSSTADRDARIREVLSDSENNPRSN